MYTSIYVQSVCVSCWGTLGKVYYCIKRDLLLYPKRPKRDLLYIKRVKREAYYYIKQDLLYIKRDLLYITHRACP